VITFTGALEIALMNKLDIGLFQFNMLQSIYSLPNIILPAVGGLLVDKIGARKGTIIFTFILIVGQGICTWGGAINSYGVLLAGRAVFALGGECLFVSQSKFYLSFLRLYH
jgi:MFS family permease